MPIHILPAHLAYVHMRNLSASLMYTTPHEHLYSPRMVAEVKEGKQEVKVI